jgi:serine/threonine protein kinase
MPFSVRDVMNGERRLRIESLYHSAIERAPNRRAGFLAEACPDDEQVRLAVQALLDQSDSRDDLLARPGWETAARLLDSETAPRLTPGALVGPYTVEALVGAGGMGEVYRARDRRLDRTVALKVVPIDQPFDPDVQPLFLQEARACSALNHANIVTIHDVGTENGIAYLGMEYVQGETLKQALATRQLSVRDKLLLSIQIAEALAAAHAGGIIHRDLKPGNAMVTAGGQIKVLDFGLATRVENSWDAANESMRAAFSSRTRIIMGTVAYMSPEQAKGLKADARSDIFSFGTVLYEMFTGSRPFTGKCSMDVLESVLKSEPVSPAELQPNLPKRLTGILLKALEKEPDNR